MKTSEDLKRAFDTLWRETVEIMPTILMGIVILLGGWILAKLLSKLIFKILEKSKNSKVFKVFSLQSVSKDYGINISLPLIVSKVVYWMIFLFFIVAASETFGWSNVSQEISVFIHYIPRILSALLIFALGYSIATFIRDAIKAMTQKMEIGVGRILADVLFYFLLLIVSLTSIAQAGINISIISGHMYIIIGGLALTFAISFGWGAREIVSDLLKNYYNRNVLNQGDEVTFGKITGLIDKVTKTSIVIQEGDNFHIVPAKEFYEASYVVRRTK